MVAGIYFMKQLLLFIFTRLLLGIRSKMLLSLAFCLAAAFLSAFLDALTVVAVVISVAVGFYGIYHRVASARPDDLDLLDDSHIDQHYPRRAGAVPRLFAQPDDARGLSVPRWAG
jgi:NhaB family Na+:H+ antiporter